jgi:hypothetical protein
LAVPLVARAASWCGYITRAIANERLALNRTGHVVLTLKTPYREGTTHIVMSPLEFIQRLAALVPRPRLDLIHFIYLLSTGVSFCVDVAPEVRGSGRVGDPHQLIPMIKMVIMAQIHMKIFKPFDRAIRETHCLKLIVINLFR